MNQSQVMRDDLAAQPQTTPNEIVSALKQQGITLLPGLVSNVKYSKPRVCGKTRRGSATTGPRNWNEWGDHGRRPDRNEARVVEQLGGIEQARRALEALEELR